MVTKGHRTLKIKEPLMSANHKNMPMSIELKNSPEDISKYRFSNNENAGILFPLPSRH